MDKDQIKDAIKRSESLIESYEENDLKYHLKKYHEYLDEILKEKLFIAEKKKQLSLM